eukprot:2919209-Rhodomonas_salina.6
MMLLCPDRTIRYVSSAHGTPVHLTWTKSGCPLWSHQRRNEWSFPADARKRLSQLTDKSTTSYT